MSRFQQMTTVLALVSILSGVMMTGCTSYATPEQLARIAELQREISSLESQIQSKQAQIGTVERQISAEQAKLDRCAKDKELVKQRLANWKGQ